MQLAGRQRLIDMEQGATEAKRRRLSPAWLLVVGALRNDLRRLITPHVRVNLCDVLPYLLDALLVGLGRGMHVFVCRVHTVHRAHRLASRLGGTSAPLVAVRR